MVGVHGKPTPVITVLGFSTPKPYPKRQFQKCKLTVKLVVNVTVDVSVNAQ
jgi:hypothetical protein